MTTINKNANQAIFTKFLECIPEIQCKIMDELNIYELHNLSQINKQCRALVSNYITKFCLAKGAKPESFLVCGKYSYYNLGASTTPAFEAQEELTRQIDKNYITREFLTTPGFIQQYKDGVFKEYQPPQQSLEPTPHILPSG